MGAEVHSALLHINIQGCVTEDYPGEEDYFFRRSGILETESEEASVKVFSEDGEMCDSEGCRKLYSYFCRDPAPRGVQQADEPDENQIRQGLRATDSRPHADRCLQPAGTKSGPHWVLMTPEVVLRGSSST